MIQHDAACRVIARLKKERDEARDLLLIDGARDLPAQADRQVPAASATATAPGATSNGKRGWLCKYVNFDMQLLWDEAVEASSNTNVNLEFIARILV